ncbi:hypothetical protein [Nocardioides insulae]|uniref:hypothetical protein n=1 Tax=Nocardioides insulae TaxID=394734 RepID=UPI0004212FB7|nr:hypothetical protein [Nocardioides insulae]
MSEQPQDGAAASTDAGSPAIGEVGLPEIDAALAEVGGLTERPVAEHVEVFERAQDTLRRTLETSSDDG